MKRISLTTIKSFVWRTAFIMLMLVMVSSHFTFRYAAKFTSTVTGTDTGKVAFFVGGDVQDGRLEPQPEIVQLVTKNYQLYYVFRAGIRVEFAACEVAREFTFSLSLDPADARDPDDNVVDSRASLACPIDFPTQITAGQEPFQYYDPDSDTYFSVLENASLEDITGVTDLSIVQDQIYFYSTIESFGWKVGKIEGENASYVYKDGNKTVINYTPNNVGIFIPANTEAEYTFSFLFFIDAYVPEEDVGEEDSTLEYDHPIKYDLNCWQVD